MPTAPFHAGIQIRPASFSHHAEVDVLQRLQDQMGLDALMVFHDGQVRSGNDSEPDLLDRLHTAGSPLGVAIYAHLGQAQPADGEAAMIGCDSERIEQGCLRDPAWRERQITWFRQLFRSHDHLAGGMFMHERQGPLTALFGKPNDKPAPIPFCFCNHCCAAGRLRGLDPDRARTGYRRLRNLVAAAYAGESPPREGWFLTFLRLIMSHHEILAWEQLFYDGLHGYRTDLVSTIKSVRPTASIGYHVQNHTMLYDLFYRGNDAPEQVASYADWIKLSCYPGVSGTRGRSRLRRLRQTLFADCDPGAARSVLAGWFGRTLDDEADLDHDGPAGGFAPSWIGKEIARWRAALPTHPILNGLGIGVPGTADGTETPAYIAACCRAGYEAGADGVLLSRHHDEMADELITAAGTAIAEHRADGQIATQGSLSG